MRWIAPGTCALLLAVWFASGFYGVAWVCSPRYLAFVDGGLFAVYWRETTIPAGSIMVHLPYANWPRAGRHPKVRTELYAACYRAAGGNALVCARCYPLRFGVGEGWQLVKQRGSSAGVRGLLIPIWLPFMILAIPLVVLWLSHARKPPGYCRRCGYDLTGNVSGRCPECGTPVGGES